MFAELAASYVRPCQVGKGLPLAMAIGGFESRLETGEVAEIRRCRDGDLCHPASLELAVTDRSRNHQPA